MQKKNVLIVKNPKAANGRRVDLVPEVADILKAQGALVEIYETKLAGDAIDFLMNYNGEANVVIAAGGDGTVNEVLNGLIHKDLPVGLIPTGTTNVLAKELGLPKSAKGLADVILTGLEKPVYLGQLNGKRFCLMVGVGYDAWIVNYVDLDMKKKYGKLAYVISMFKSVLPFGGQSFEAEIDGEKMTVSSMMITKGRHYAGSFILSRKADLSHKSIQAIVVTTPNKFKFLLCTFSLPFGLMESMPFVRSIAAKEIKISTNISNDLLDVLEADGDTAGCLPALIKVEESPVSMLAPL